MPRIRPRRRPRAFRDRLREVGVKIGGKVKVGSVPKKLRGTPALGEYESPTIAALVAATNKPSDNFYAEMLLKRLVATDKRQGTTEAGAKAVESFAKQLGSKVDARDGSGLTDANRASAKDVVRLLAAAQRREGDRRAPLQLPRHRRQGRHPLRPHERHRRRRQLPRQDRHDQRRLEPLRLLPRRRRA